LKRRDIAHLTRNQDSRMAAQPVLPAWMQAHFQAPSDASSPLGSVTLGSVMDPPDRGNGPPPFRPSSIASSERGSRSASRLDTAEQLTLPSEDAQCSTALKPTDSINLSAEQSVANNLQQEELLRRMELLRREELLRRQQELLAAQVDICGACSCVYN